MTSSSAPDPAPDPAAVALTVEPADLIAAAVLRCPAVVALHPGGHRQVATYLPGRRVAGVHVDDDGIRIALVGVIGVPVRELDAQVRSAVAPYALGRPVDVYVADIQPTAGVGSAHVHHGLER